jgi:rhamnulokinase
MRDALYTAVDLSPGRGRVVLCGVEPGELLLVEVCRFRYPASRSRGHLRWDVDRIFDETKVGLLRAGDRARELGRPIRSVGVVSWGADYGLVDSDGHLVDCPIAYPGDLTLESMQRVFERVPSAEIFERTGTQFLRSNTLFQLYSHCQKGIPRNAARLLMIPDLINLFLTGRAVNEFTNATTTQLVNSATGDWDRHMAKRLGLPSNLLNELVPAGTNIGVINLSLAAELRVGKLRVVAPATHDVASAVAGTPLREGWAYVISSGARGSVGVERANPLINEEVAQSNFTNEAGAFGNVCFNVKTMGLGVLESCIAEWKGRGVETDTGRLFARAGAMRDFHGFILPDDPCFAASSSMLETLKRHLIESGQSAPTDPAVWTKMILDSIALNYRSLLHKLESLTGKRVLGLHLIGENCAVDYLNQATANATGLPVLAGPSDATVTGNILIQAIASGRFSSLVEGRAHLARNLALKKYIPERSPLWEEAARRFQGLEAQFTHRYLRASFSAPNRLAG